MEINKKIAIVLHVFFVVGVFSAPLIVKFIEQIVEGK